MSGVIVTGSTTGIGEAIARRLVADGRNVLIHGLEHDDGVARELGMPFLAADLADAAAADKLLAAARDAFGSVDAVCNNAAAIVRSNLETTDAEVFDLAMSVNARAPMLLIRAAFDDLRAHQGCVLNIGSVNAYCGERTQLAYSMSKGALMTMTRNLADALGPMRVRVNQLNLGWVLTPNEYALKMTEGLPADWPSRVGSEYAPSGELMQPEQVAEAAAYWLSDRSRPVSGAVVDFNQYPVIGRNPPKAVD